jgi:hypothetical protein
MPKSRKRIEDEFTALPVSRQRKLQLRYHRAGLCITCGVPAMGTLCEAHAIARALRQLGERGCGKATRRGKWLVRAGLR